MKFCLLTSDALINAKIPNGQKQHSVANIALP